MTSNRDIEATLTNRMRAKFADLKIRPPRWKRSPLSHSTAGVDPAFPYLATSKANGGPIDTRKGVPVTTPPVDEKSSTCSQNLDQSISRRETTSGSDSNENSDSDPVPPLAKPTTTTLLSLPFELIQHIGSYINENTIQGGNTFWILRLTCTQLYAILGPPTYHLTARYIYMDIVKAIIPGNLAYCEDCKKYHPRRPGDTYTFDNNINVRCIRYLRSCGKSEHAILGRQYYVCETCYSRRYRRYCQRCKICEICTGLKFKLEESLVLDGREKKGEPEREYCDDCSARAKKD